MKLIEFEGEIVEVGDAGVKISRDNALHGKARFPSGPDEEKACGAHLYRRVRVTVELIVEEPTS